MSKVSRRGFVVMSAGGVAAAVLAACGQVAVPADTTAPADKAAPAQKEVAPPAAKERVELHLWRHPLFVIFTDFAAEFNEMQNEYTVIEEAVASTDGGGVYTKYATSLASGSPPDFSHAGVGNVQQFGVTGGIIELNDHYRTSAVVKEADIWPTLMNDTKLHSTGQIFSVPWGPDLRVMYLHSQIFLEAGLDPDSFVPSWDAVEDIVAQTTIISGDNVERAAFPPFWGSGGNWLWQVPFWQLGGETSSEDMTTITINNEHGIRAVEWLKKLHDAQGGWDAIERLRESATRALAGGHDTLFANGRTAMYYDTFSTRGENFGKNFPDLKFGYSPWPKPEGGQDANLGGHHMFVISAAPPNHDGAWAFIEWFSQPDTNLRVAKILDRVPIRPETTNSVDYTEGDPFRELIGQQMPFRRFSIPAPGGGTAMAATASTIPDMMAGKVTIQEGLAQAQDAAQLALDEWKD